MINITLSDYIKVSGIPKGVFSEITKRLTYPNPKFVNAEKYGQGKIWRIARTLKSYEYHDGELYLPRGYYLEFLAQIILPLQSPYQIIDLRKNDQSIQLPQLATPRSYQTKMIEEALSYPGPSCIIQAPPGAGKTFTGLELARREGRKTLWITHTTELANQTTHAASDESSVPVLGIPKKEIGLIGQGKFDIGEFLTIATVQTLFKKKKEFNKLKEEFGTIIVDEVHHAPANSWQAGTHLFAPYLTIGLTATSYRNDGLTQLMYDCMGPVVTRADKDLLINDGVLITPTVYMLSTDSYLAGIDYAKLLSTIVEHKHRNRLLFSIIKRISANPHNTLIVLSARRQHVDEITEMCERTELSPLKMLGDMSAVNRTLAAEKIRAKETKLIIATYKLLSEGFDYPSLNYVLFATPFKDSVLVEQCVGRAQRMSPGKTHASIIDLVDSNPVLYKQARERFSVYSGLGMNCFHSLTVNEWLNSS